MFRNGAWNLDYLKLHWWRISEQQQFAWIRRKEETLNDTIELIAICPCNIAVMLIKYDEEESGGCVSINRSEKNLFVSKILFQRKLGGGKKGGWNEIVGPSNRILCRWFDETEGRFRNKDFIAGQRIVSEISIVLFEHPRFAVSRSVVVDCIVFRTSSAGRGEEGWKRGEKGNAPFPYTRSILCRN